MVRKSILVYDLLRTEQPEGGFTEKEIVELISSKHDIMAGKSLRKQVAVALRRGLDFGIIAKKNNKFKFDPDSGRTSTIKRETRSRRSSKRSRNKTTAKKSANSRQGSSSTKTTNRNQRRQMPAPKLPKSWTPNKRNLADEPVSKVKKI